MVMTDVHTEDEIAMATEEEIAATAHTAEEIATTTEKIAATEITIVMTTKRDLTTDVAIVRTEGEKEEVANTEEDHRGDRSSGHMAMMMKTARTTDEIIRAIMKRKRTMNQQLKAEITLLSCRQEKMMMTMSQADWIMTDLAAAEEKADGRMEIEIIEDHLAGETVAEEIADGLPAEWKAEDLMTEETSDGTVGGTVDGLMAEEITEGTAVDHPEIDHPEIDDMIMTTTMTTKIRMKPIDVKVITM